MIKHLFSVILAILALAGPVRAQSTGSLTVATVTRPPFSMMQDGVDSGFSIELWQALAGEIGATTEIVRVGSFAKMLDLVRDGKVDAAAANISITANRETTMDFSHPIFDAGLRVMVPGSSGAELSLARVLLSPDLALAILAAFGLLFIAGMLMWIFERRHGGYFDHPPRTALFASFWWALSLVVNGGFEERAPRSWPGRLLAVFLVISSLFLVSFFVASITSAMTVEAIQSNVGSVNDLYDKRVGTTEGSTAAAFMDRREMRYVGYEDFTALAVAFEAGELDAVVFDAPVLAYYVTHDATVPAELVGSVFLRESYGIALPQGSQLTEPLNQALLRLRENGTYEAIRLKWFGPANG